MDTDSDFVVPFRHFEMWCAGKGILLRLNDIPSATLTELHTGNACCHLEPKPDTPEGRFIIDASNVSDG